VIEDFIDENSSTYNILENTEVLTEIDFFKIEFLFSALLFDLYKW
jgi:hypothetical protein